MPVGRFLAGIGAVIWDPNNHQYLLLRRSDHRDYGGGSWECVTGRVDQGEGFEDALYREVKEEIGVEIQIEFLLGTTHFYRGNPPSPKNELVGVFYGCTLAGKKPTSFSHEHKEHRWLAYNEAMALLPENHWLRPVLSRAELLQKHTPGKLRAVYHNDGFELTDYRKNTL